MRTAVGTREVLRRRRASEKASQQIVMTHANVLVTGGDMVWLSTLCNVSHVVPLLRPAS